MNLRPVILVCSADEDVMRRITAAAGESYGVITAAGWAGALDRLAAHAPVATVVDSRGSDAFDHLDEWPAKHPDVPVILIAPPRSDRALRAERLDLFAIADPATDFREWRQLFELAEKHHRLKLELRDAAARPPAPPDLPAARAPEPASAAAPAAPGGSPILAHVAGAFRHFGHVDLMLDRALEGIAAAAFTARAGLFARHDATGRYRLRAGQRTMRETASAEYEAHDPLVRWFERHAHMVTRTMAGQVPDPEDRRVLTRALELAGADVIVPLHARGALLGWLFLGCRITGQPYGLRDLEDISHAADYLAMLLENALLYREVTVQKTLAEALLHALPTGIIAVDGGGAVRWFSTAAEKMLGRPAAEAIGRPVESLGVRIADAARRAMAGQPPPSVTWEEAATRRFLRIEARTLGGADDQLGAVLVIEDLTAIRQMQEKQEQFERAAFWTDLAAGLSHEIRNPLVTIRTFAQLLPERYQDDEFREEFSRMVGHEVDRLSGIIDQINDFAHPPDPVRARADVRVLLQQAFRKVMESGPAKPVSIQSEFDGNLPLVEADERALTDCFTHLIRNAVEAMDGRTDPVIACSAHLRDGPGRDPVVEVNIRDNGRGISPELLDKVFSPFYTTKARGMGLGLPIVKRTVVEHNGTVSIDSSGAGTCVVIQLPAAGTRAGETP